MRKTISSYFHLPNEILSCGLTGTELAVAVHLYSLQSAGRQTNLLGGCVKVRQETLCTLCGISLASVKRAVVRLMEIGIITSATRTVRRDRMLGTYTYCLKLFPNRRAYFRVFRAAIRKLPANLLRTYLYAVKRKTSGIGGFFKSYSELALELGMKRSDIIKQMTALSNLGLLRRIRKRTSCGDYTDNTYIVVVFVQGRVRAKAPSILLDEAPIVCTKHTAIIIVKNIIQRLCAFVKGFPKIFFASG
ncbi:MAG: hypothetical protein QM689_01705 [Oscillospiraceae bacterium]